MSENTKPEVEEKEAVAVTDLDEGAMLDDIEFLLDEVESKIAPLALA